MDGRSIPKPLLRQDIRVVVDGDPGHPAQQSHGRAGHRKDLRRLRRKLETLFCDAYRQRVSQTNGTATTPNCIVSSSHQLGFGVCTCFCVADQYAQSLTTAYPKPGTPNLDLATATLRCRKVLMKPICRNAAVGTPAKQPIAVAVDQPPETSELPVELEAWASILCSGALRQRPCYLPIWCVCAAESALARAIWDELVYRSIKARIAWGTTRGHDEGCIYAGLAAFGCKRTR